MTKKLLSCLIVCFFATLSQAEITLPSVIDSHMVLQRNKPAPIWGLAEAGETVTVEFNGQKKTTKANETGEWMISLEPMKANAKGQDMKIGSITLTDILIGEVWLCSGQSNMEWNFNSQGKDYSNPNIRFFRVKSHINTGIPMDDAPGDWNSFADGKAQGGFSGVGLHFGIKLQKELDVPVGLLDSTWGGTPIEPWLAAEGYELIGHPLRKVDTPNLMKDQQKIIANVEQWLKKAKMRAKFGKVMLFDADTKINIPRTQNGMYNGMIHPLVPFAIKGTIWYQGESNRTRKGYFEKLQALIGGWKKVFKAEKFPFYLVQIAPFNYNGNIPRDNTVLCNNIWTAQYKAAKEIEDCGIIPTHDTIEGNIKNIHPNDKKSVGERLAAMALNKTYGKDVICSGPVFKRAVLNGSKVVISFDKIDQGLDTADGKAPTWFELSEDGKAFVAAEAAIDGKTVIVSSSKVTAPKFVRMGWSEISIPTLRDKNGWPVFQFSAKPVK